MAPPSQPERQNASTPLPPFWLIGAGLLSFGLVVGFTITALPFLLTHAGVPLYKAAGISAIVMSPTFWAFLLQPIMDTGLTRRAYCWLTAIIAAAAMAAALMLLSPGRLTVTTALLLIAELSMVLYSGAFTGWLAEFLPDGRRGIVSGWTNVANLGGGAIGSLAVMSLARRIPRPELAAGMAVIIILGVAPTIWFPAPGRSMFRFGEIFTKAMEAIWRACKTPECVTGFALFLAPASAEAAINLFSGMGPDFHTPATTVIWVTGLGCAITASIGALIGGYLADRVPRGLLYLGAGMITGVLAIALALAPKTPGLFIFGALVYNGLAGVVYAAFNALGWQIVGKKTAVASTQLGLFSAAINFAIVYMTWADGRGFKHFGVHGLLLTDGLASVIAGSILLLIFRHRLGGRRLEKPAAAVLSE